MKSNFFNTNKNNKFTLNITRILNNLFSRREKESLGKSIVDVNRPYEKTEIVIDISTSELRLRQLNNGQKHFNSFATSTLPVAIKQQYSKLENEYKRLIEKEQIELVTLHAIHNNMNL